MNSSIPVRGKAWSSSGNLVTDGKSRFSVQAVFANNPGDYVVQFNTNLAGNFGGDSILSNLLTGIASTEALVTWSVEGNGVDRIISIANGARISGCGQSVRVVVSDTSNVNNKNFPYTVAVLITPGTRSAVQQPPVYNPAGSLNATTVTLANWDFGPDVPPSNVVGTIPVPIGAGVISYYMTYQASVSQTQVVLTEANLTLAEIGSANHRIYSPVKTVGQWVPLIPGTTALQFTMQNMPNLSTTRVQVLWGIDG